MRPASAGLCCSPIETTLLTFKSVRARALHGNAVHSSLAGRYGVPEEGKARADRRAVDPPEARSVTEVEEEGGLRTGAADEDGVVVTALARRAVGVAGAVLPAH